MKNLQNSVQLIGRTGNDIAISKTDGETSYTRFSIATNESYTNKSGAKVENTTWHKCIAWGKTAELIAQYVSKGDKIAIQGNLTNRSYDDKEGVTRYVTEVRVNEVMFLDLKSNASAAEQAENPSTDETNTDTPVDGE